MTSLGYGETLQVIKDEDKKMIIEIFTGSSIVIVAIHHADEIVGIGIGNAQGNILI